ncbi:MAG: hypothetical protein ACJAVV_002807 [Alphaproteobacteria bacterium]|jgi:hypothetical protein
MRNIGALAGEVTGSSPVASTTFYLIKHIDWTLSLVGAASTLQGVSHWFNYISNEQTPGLFLMSEPTIH